MIYGYMFGDPGVTHQLSYTCGSEEQSSTTGQHKACLSTFYRHGDTNVVRKDDPSLSLIYANRQIHAETHSLPHKNTMFGFEGSATLEKFMSNRLEAQKAAIQYIQINLMARHCGDYHLVFEERKWISCLAGMSGVKMIYINECGLATGSMVDACVVEVFKVVSKSSPEVTIEAEGRDPYYKG